MGTWAVEWRGRGRPDGNAAADAAATGGG
eukprot:SAG31_NODE_37332_length_305_cov_0.752427_1_plen_28_part_10